MKCSRLSENDDVDNSANWTNQEKELLNPCVGLVRTARASIKKVCIFHVFVYIFLVLSFSVIKIANFFLCVCLILQVGEAVRIKGHCRDTNGAEQLDRLALAAEKLSPAVDTFVASVYPPMNKSSVSSTVSTTKKKILFFFLGR